MVELSLSQAMQGANPAAPPPYIPPYSSLRPGSKPPSIAAQSVSFFSLVSPNASATDPTGASDPPAFSPKTRPDELSLEFQPPSSASSHYVYESRSMTLNLGSRIEGAATPAFGNNATIDGTLYVKDWNHVKDITLTIIGTVHTTLLENGTPVARQHPLVLNHVQSLWSSITPSTSALHHSTSSSHPAHPKAFPISFPIPTYAYGSASLLPPSRRAASSNLRLLVKYELFVDLHREGCLLHRHERVGGEWKYLPKSVPDPTGIIEGTPDEQPRSNATGFKPAELPPAPAPDPWKVLNLVPSGGRHSSPDIIVQLGLPRPLSYTSGIPIPYRVFIIPAAAGSSISALEVHSSLAVSLVKVIAFSFRHQTTFPQTIEKVLGEGMPWKVETKPGAEGIWQVDGYVNGVKAGGEMSWGLEGCVNVKYLLRVVYMYNGIRFTGEQPVQLVTDDLGAIDIEAEEDAWERPQLGLWHGSCDPNSPENGGGSWVRRVVLF